MEKLKMDYGKTELERAYRTGKPTTGTGTRPRPIIVKFLRFKDKVVDLEKAKNLKGTYIFLNEDYPEAVHQKSSLIIIILMISSLGKWANFSRKCQQRTVSQ